MPHPNICSQTCSPLTLRRSNAYLDTKFESKLTNFVTQRGRGILHIELRRWADLLVIAPLSANTMARIVNGFADNLLTSVVRAWDPWGELDPAQVPNTTSSTGNTGTAAQDTATVVPMTQEGTSEIRGNRRPKKRRIIVAPASK